MFTMMFRAIILYAILLIVIRIMGKRQIAQLQPFELVITLIIADLATIPMGETTVPLIHGVVPLLTLVSLHYLMSILSRKSIFLRKLINGKPVIVINPNGIDYKALKLLNMNLNDLCEGLRGAGYFCFEDIGYAIIETNGNMSVLPKAENSPITKKDLNITQEQTTLNVMLINDGKIIKENLDFLGLEQSFLDKILKKQKAKLKNVLILSINKSGQIYFQQHNQKYVTFNKDGENV